VKLSSWPEIGSDGDVLLTPYVPKGITGYDDDDDDDEDSNVCFKNYGLNDNTITYGSIILSYSPHSTPQS
jgi:hypothetical protein